MAHHDKGKTKRKGSSCRMCKPHKRHAYSGNEDMQTLQERRAREAEAAARLDADNPERYHDLECLDSGLSECICGGEP